MKRILLVLTVALVMVAMVLVMAGTALARGPSENRANNFHAAGGISTAETAFERKGRP